MVTPPVVIVTVPLALETAPAKVIELEPTEIVPAFVVAPVTVRLPAIAASALASTVSAAIVPVPKAQEPAATAIVGEPSNEDTVMALVPPVKVAAWFPVSFVIASAPPVKFVTLVSAPI